MEFNLQPLYHDLIARFNGVVGNQGNETVRARPLRSIIGSYLGRHLRADVAFIKVGRSICLSAKADYLPL
jgi:hypothetical protein